jgi:hypothetical protein
MEPPGNQPLSYATPRTRPAGSVPLIWKLIVVSLWLGGMMFLIGILAAFVCVIRS